MKKQETKRLMYYGFGFSNTATPETSELAKSYSTELHWKGNVSNNYFAFSFIGVKEFMHKKKVMLKLQDKNNSEEVSSREELYISVPPKVQLIVSNTTLSVGDRITIKCNLSIHGRPKANIIWYHNEKQILEKNGTYFFNQDEVEIENSGSYQCHAKNSVGEVTSDLIRITVTDNPINKERSSGGGLEGGAIAGIVVPIIVVIIVIVIIVFIKKRQKAPKTPKQTASNDDTKMPMNSPPKDQVWL
ncbi:coxsackievirus and adenovirus receptor homolog [Xenia sp. Carnegie-2017]|uniref:coxsackievirus and adenovirus receptor homolog n=1 Tax=Xenia sp. Carnegie-2017 TaxID=2897299 RepID=UPI001F0448BF|nr:coxsackievirus and adenovirus receptor homolog [Xenia sp. Carnegie-2017]